jgi:hypothetical protein
VLSPQPLHFAVDETEHDKVKAITTTVTMETKRIPIYVHFATQRYIIYITNDSLRDIQKGILEKSRIPIDLQMIVYQGRIHMYLMILGSL